MALEIARSAGAIYRINPVKRTEIQTREAAPRSRWRFFRVCASAETAAQEMLRLGSRPHGAPQKNEN